MQAADNHERSGEPRFGAIYWMDRDGSNLHFLFSVPGLISTGTSAWSHDGHYIAFDGPPQLEDFLFCSKRIDTDLTR